MKLDKDQKRIKKLLKNMDKEKLGWLLLSEKTLAKDWLTTEEDEAWKDL